MLDFIEVAQGLRFPEGPIACADGTLLVVEIQGGSLTRIYPDGRKEVVAELGGGPNGAAIGPDGRCYVCNNGGLGFRQIKGCTMPMLASESYSGGWIDVVDLESGEVNVLFRNCGDIGLSAPNDIVFDQYGGFWFTDSGKMHRNHRDRGGIFYALPDGSLIKRVVFPLEGANGIGLSPDGRILYATEAHAGRLWAYEIVGPGEIRRGNGPIPWEHGDLLGISDTYSIYDSLAVDHDGNICVADIPLGGITVFSPDGRLIEKHPMPDVFPTNICFGGDGLQTAYITLSSTGRIIAMPWPRGGLSLHWLLPTFTTSHT
ncbi:SMP-30/gluconolactonase/LRE family protein [Alcaligenaceae bacterium]|nr:SMP-30/gluconolactonase/LRE family protein [Alcaligenaceae bacterium]